MFSLLVLALGVAMLIVGGTLLVRGASEVAAAQGVSPLVIGLTVVGFGSSAPELIINIVAALNSATGLAFGNVIGSNISNLALILGAAAVIAPITVQGQIVRREVPLLLMATSVILVMSLDDPLEGSPAMIGRSESLVLFLLFGIFVYVNVLDILVRRKRDPILADIEDNPLIETRPKGRYQWLFILGGVILLAIGGETTIRSGIAVSETLGISTTVVGLFMIAVGTSMPELVTTVIAAVRKESDLALGNVVGSNIVNSLVVLPAGGVISQIPVPSGGISDILLSWILAAILIPVFFFGEARLDRKIGIVMLVLYLGYAVGRIYLD